MVFISFLANPKQVKALHGRKSDKRDSQRIAEFLQDRRLDSSFVPPPEIRRLRDLLRHRVSLLEQRNQTHNKIRDLFETANLKLSSVASHLLGVSGQRIIEALIAGETSADKLSWKVKGRLRKKEKQVLENSRAKGRSVRFCCVGFQNPHQRRLYETASLDHKTPCDCTIR